MADTSLNIAFREEPISIQQGDDVEITFAVKTSANAAVNLTSGYTAVLRSRVSPGDDDPIINLGMNLRILPVIGVTLPFYSAGGTSVMMMYICVGIVVSVYMHNKKSLFGNS